MKRLEAIEAVNAAFQDAKSTEAIHDAEAKELTVTVDGKTATHTFAHGVHALEQRKHELALFKKGLIDELSPPEKLLSPIVVETADEGDEQPPAKTTPPVPAVPEKT